MTSPEYRRDPETTARLADLALDTLRRQLSTADALDAKTWQAFGAGSIILALGVAGDLDGWRLVVPLASYIVLAYGALVCLRVRKFDVLPATRSLWEGNWFRPALDLDHAVIDALVTAQKTNADILHEKAQHLRMALGGLAVETVALVLAAIL